VTDEQTDKMAELIGKIIGAKENLEAAQKAFDAVKSEVEEFQRAVATSVPGA